MPVTRRAFLAATGALAAGTPLYAQRRACTLEADGHRHTLKDAAGRVVLGYLTTKPEGLTGNSACCVHPFNTPGGEWATDIAPAMTGITTASSSRATTGSSRAPSGRVAATSGAGDNSRRLRDGRLRIGR